MAIDEALRAEIVRLSRAESWPVETIARHLGIHHSTVKRALRAAGADRQPRSMMIEPFIPFIKKQLEQESALPATVLWRQVQGLGYGGGVDHFRHVLRDLGLRPVKETEPSMRLHFLPGEQAQVDWAEFGQVSIGGATRTLMGLLVTLSYSRQTSLSLFYDARMPSFLHGHVEAFEAFGGVPRRLLYDNLKSAVITRRGKAVTFNVKMLELSKHYVFEPVVAWPWQPQEKGRVERRVGFVRTSFIAGLDITAPLDDLNAAARAWCTGIAADQPWPDNKALSVRDAFDREKQFLLSLPNTPFPHQNIRPVRIDKTCHARFDTNDYSVPPDYAKRMLTLVACRETVRILDGSREVAHHQRSYGRQRTVVDPDHARALAARKRHGRTMSIRDRLLRTVPRAEELLALAGRGGRNVTTCARMLTEALDLHGADETDRAIAMALDRGSPNPETVHSILEDRRDRQGLPTISYADVGRHSHGTTPRATSLDAYDRPDPSSGSKR